MAVTLPTIASALARPVRPSSARAIAFGEDVRSSIWDELAASVRSRSAANDVVDPRLSPSNLAISELASSISATARAGRSTLASAITEGIEAWYGPVKAVRARRGP